MRISDWSSDVCSSDLVHVRLGTFKLAFCHDLYPLTFKETGMICRAPGSRRRGDGYLLGPSGDDFVSDVLGGLGVMLEFHRVRGTTLRQRAQVGGVKIGRAHV